MSAALSSTPFGARAGERVTHKILISYRDPLPPSPIGLDFTSTAVLDNMTVTSSQGGCQPLGVHEVRCELGKLTAGSTPDVTIQATVGREVPKGGVIRNTAMLRSDKGAEGEAAVNGYLLSAEPDNQAVTRMTPPPAPPSSSRVTSFAQLVDMPPPVSLAAAVLLVGTVWITRRRFRYEPRHRAPRGLRALFSRERATEEIPAWPVSAVITRQRPGRHRHTAAGRDLGRAQVQGAPMPAIADH